MEPTSTGLPDIRGYRGLTRIGRGGFSFVYRAEQISLGRDVAIKILLTDLADEAEVRRFTNECQILGRLGQHRHVVDVYDAGVTDDGRPFIVMKFYGRGSLADRLRDTGPLSPQEVTDIGVKLATALQAAHDIGVIHRDVKPDNVLIDDNGEPVLTDFGVAAVADAAGRFTSSVAFSHAHVAPEVLDRNEFGVPSDIYSLGSTLYTLLTGRAAFAAETEARQIVSIMHDPVPPIQDPRVPAELSALIIKAMSKQPEERFASAGDMATALESIPASWGTPGDSGRTLIDPYVPRVVAAQVPAAPVVVETPQSGIEPDVEATRIRPATRPPAPEPIAEETPEVAVTPVVEAAVEATVIRASTRPPVREHSAASVSTDAQDPSSEGADKPEIATHESPLAQRKNSQEEPPASSVPQVEEAEVEVAVPAGLSAEVENQQKPVGSSAQSPRKPSLTETVGAAPTRKPPVAGPTVVLPGKKPGRKVSGPAVVVAAAVALVAVVGVGLILTFANGSATTADPNSAAAVAAPATYKVSVNYANGAIKDQTYSGSAPAFAIDVCLGDTSLTSSATKNKIKLQRKSGAKLVSVPATVTAAKGGRCKASQVNVVLKAATSKPPESALNKGFGSCTNYRAVIPETTKYAATNIDACVKTQAVRAA